METFILIIGGLATLVCLAMLIYSTIDKKFGWCIFWIAALGLNCGLFINELEIMNKHKNKPDGVYMTVTETSTIVNSDTTAVSKDTTYTDYYKK